MCVLLICQNPTPEVSLVVLHNRDEFIDRPFEAAHVREIGKQRYGFGIDSIGNGTWFAAKENGTFSAVLNIRSSLNREKRPKSRGELPFSALLQDAEFESLSNRLQNETAAYNPFNLILGGINRPTEVYSSSTKSYRKFSDQIFSLSNHSVLDSWQKPIQLARLFEKNIITKCFTVSELRNIAFQILENTQKLPESDLPNTAYPKSIEHELSSQFVKIPASNYQTVLSTVFIVPKNGKPILFEKNHLLPEQAINEVTL